MAAATLEEYRNWHGKIEVVNRVAIDSPAKLAKVYTPGVAAPCKEIARDPELSFDYTRRGNLVAVVTDGSAVLGLGDIGPEAGMPVMEGKAALLKSQANVDGFPLCIKSEDTDDIVHTIELLSGTFGAIHLEDIAAPRCFEIEARLREALDIPVYHDDQQSLVLSSCCSGGSVSTTPLLPARWTSSSIPTLTSTCRLTSPALPLRSCRPS